MTMRTWDKAVVIGIMGTVASTVAVVFAQEGAKATSPPPASDAGTAPSKPVIPSRAELEKQFEEELTGATLTGVWQMTGEGGLSGKSALTPPKPDQYVISKVSKMGEDYWIITARIQYAEKDVNIPVPVRMVWAEDTAIITLNDWAMPLLGTYSARVMIHHGFYSGVWYCGGKNYGGVMQGRITKTPADGPNETKKPTE
jgi:hypothetical protein